MISLGKKKISEEKIPTVFRFVFFNQLVINVSLLKLPFMEEIGN